jgi:hypothetical protein
VREGEYRECREEILERSREKKMKRNSRHTR